MTETVEMEVDATTGPRSIEVNKPLQVDIDMGTMLLSDPNDVDYRSLRATPEAYLKTLARDNTQLLINSIWTLPFERVDDVVITKLPPSTYILPREKAAPKPRPLTKWESYAKEKGITKVKKSKTVWDEVVKKWVPRYGYRKAEVETEKEWCLEVPGGADPFEDQFEKRAEIKAEKVSKNEVHRLRNLAKAKKVTVPSGSGLIPKERKTRAELGTAMRVAKAATASLGKFQDKLKGEKKVKGQGGKKRTFEPLVQKEGAEKSKNLAVLESVMRKKPKLDVEKAVNSQVRVKEAEKSAFRSKSQKSDRAGGGRGGPKRSEGKRRGGAGSKAGGGGGPGGGGRKGKGR